MKTCRQERVDCHASVANILVGVAETELVVGGVGGAGWGVWRRRTKGRRRVLTIQRRLRGSMVKMTMMWMRRMRRSRRRSYKGERQMRRMRIRRTKMKALAAMRLRVASERLIGTPGEYAIVNARSWSWAEGLDCQTMGMVVVEDGWV